MTDDSRSRRNRGLAVALGSAAAILIVPLLIPLLSGRVFTHDDLQTFHLPLRFLYRQALRAGDSTLWTPSLFSGLYLLGEGQAGTLHPWHWLIYRALPLGVAFNVELVSSYLLGCAGAYILLRRVPLRRESAAFGALLAAFSGFNLLHVIHLNMVAGLAHVPWLLIALDALMVARRRMEISMACAAVAIVIASQWLLGFPQAIYLTVLIAAPFAIARGWQLKRLDRVVLSVLAAGTGTLIGAVQWLPMTAAARASARSGATPAFLLSYSLHPLNLWQLTAPYAIADRVYAPGASPMHEFGLYAGASVPAALMWLAIRWRALRHRALAVGCLALIAVALVLAFGRFTPVLPLLVSLPGYPPFRAPARHVAIVHFACAVLVAIAFDDLIRPSRSDGEPLRRSWMLLVPSALAIVGLFAFPALSDAAPAPFRQAWAGSIPTLTIAWLMLEAARARQWAAPALIVCAALDLAVWGYTPLWRSAPADLASIARDADVPRRGGAYVHVNPAYGNVAVLRGFRLSNGYVALEPRRALPETASAVLRVSGVSWADDGRGWKMVPDPLPRVRLVARTVVADDPARIFDSIDHATAAIVDRAVPPLEGPAGSATLVEDKPGRLLVQTSASGAQLLVTTERFDEGWIARSGCLEPARRVNGDFLGCVVPSGTHAVAFEFDPPSFRLGRRLTIVGAASLALLMILTVTVGRDRAD